MIEKRDIKRVGIVVKQNHDEALRTAQELTEWLEKRGIDTIGGFVFTRLGYLPASGAKLEVPGLAITVRRAARKRIEEILLEKTTPKAFGAAA